MCGGKSRIGKGYGRGQPPFSVTGSSDIRSGWRDPVRIDRSFSSTYMKTRNSPSYDWNTKEASKYKAGRVARDRNRRSTVYRAAQHKRSTTLGRQQGRSNNSEGVELSKGEDEPARSLCRNWRELVLESHQRKTSGVMEVYPSNPLSLGDRESWKERSASDGRNLKESLIWIVSEQGNGAWVAALIDTGSSINVMNKTVIPHVVSTPLCYRPVRLKGVSGQINRAVEWRIVKLAMPNGVFSTFPCLVTDNLPVSLLLGMPWMVREQVIIDVDCRRLQCRSGTYKWRSDHEITVASLLNEVKLLQPSFGGVSGEHLQQLEDALSPTLLSPEGIEKARQLFIKFSSIWTTVSYGQARGVCHEIQLVDPRPIALPTRHIPLRHQEFVAQETLNMIRDGVCEPTNSPYCTYPVLVPKADGGVRFAVDYRKLNALTIPDKMPLPRIEDLIALTEESVYFALLDLRGGFWQIPMRAEHKKYTAFRTHQGLYHFKTMPFGLINAPSTFQRWMNTLLGDLRNDGVLVYLDDMLIHARTETLFLERLETVLQRLADARAYLKMSKCEVARTQFNYLGHTFREGRRYPQQRRIEALRKIRLPNNLKELRSVFGMLSYYRKYVASFAQKAFPIIRLLSKDVPFNWSEQCSYSLKLLIEELGEAVLRVPPKGEAFRLETDASEVGLGAVLYDKEEFATQENPLPIMFLSKTLTPAERNWDTAEREAYAIVWALEQCDPYVRGRCVDLVCDHKNLLWMLSKKRGKIARWCSRLTEYHINLIYQGGEENIVADVFSRYIEGDPCWKDTMQCYVLDDCDPFVGGGESSVSQEDIEGDKAAANGGAAIAQNEEENHPRINPHVEGVTPGEIIRCQAMELPPVVPKEMYFYNNRWMYLQGLWVPPSCRLRVLDMAHLMMPMWHPRVTKMTKHIERVYKWKGLAKDVQDYVRSCLYCQRTCPGMGIRNYPQYCHPVDGPFQVVYVDLFGPVVWLGEEEVFLLVMIDNFTKWVEIGIVKHKSTAEISEVLLSQWVARFGSPSKIITDNDTVFVSAGMNRLMQILDVRSWHSTVYHPQGNAPAESFNRFLKQQLTSLRTYAGDDLSLVEIVSWILLAYRSTIHLTSGESPAYLALGHDISLGRETSLHNNWRHEDCYSRRLDVLAEIRIDRRRKAEHLQQKALIEQGEESLDSLRLNDVVLIRLTDMQHRKLGQMVRSAKLVAWWSLPMRVTEVNAKGVVARVRCLTTGWEQVVHIERCRRIKDVAEGSSLRQTWDFICQKESYLFMKLRGTQKNRPRKRPRVEDE